MRRIAQDFAGLDSAVSGLEVRIRDPWRARELGAELEETLGYPFRTLDWQRQNQSLLASMDRRGKAQLRLQETVEGLSVAAVTYYLVGLIGTMVDSIGLHDHKGPIVGVAIPVVAVILFLGVRRMRRRISAGEVD